MQVFDPQDLDEEERALYEAVENGEFVPVDNQDEERAKAIAAANKEHPKEALQPAVDHWNNLAARYEYLREHKVILRKLGRSES